MTDFLIASRIARAEHEERVRALLREEQLLNDILPEDYDAWTTGAASRGRIGLVGNLLSSVGEKLIALGDRLNREPETSLDHPITGQKRRTMAG